MEPKSIAMRQQQSHASSTSSERYEFLAALRELDARSCSRELEKIVTIAASASSTFLSDISIWLVEGLGTEEASAIMRRFLLRTVRPFHISSGEIQPIATTSDKTEEPERPTEMSENPEGKVFKEIEVVCTLSVASVPTISSVTLEANGSTKPTVRIGDLLSWVKIPGASLSWWEVKEIRVTKRTLMLKNTLKCEYKELFLVQLYGAVVKRAQPGEEPICFTLPKPDFHQLREQIDELRVKYGVKKKRPAHGLKCLSSKGSVGESVSAKVWTQQKELKHKAKILMQSIDPRAAKDKKQWLRVGRTLKSLSRGTSDLLCSWIEWTNKAELPGINPSVCKNVWDMFRPATNCDDESVVKLRAFFKGYDFSNKTSGTKVLAENSVPLSLEEIKTEMLKEINPKSAKLLRELNEVFAVAESIDTKEVVFYSSVDCFSEDKQDKPTMEPFEVASEKFSVIFQLSKLSSPEYKGMEQLSATLKCGDIVRLPYLHRFTITTQAPANSVSPDGWHRIIDVDVIFARVRVLVTTAPPECWLSSSNSSSSSSSTPLPFWIPIANFWNILVCRNNATDQQSPRRIKDGASISYQSFITPLESVASSLAYLSYLPTVQRTFEVPNDGDSNHVLICKTLQTSSTSVVVAWNLYPKLADGKLGKCVHSNSMKDLFFSVLICPPLDVHWHQIYRGTGEACQISSLLPLQIYQVKIEAKSKVLSAAVKYIHVTTLAGAPCLPLCVDEWFVGAKPGTVRFQLFISPEIRVDLPSGCLYVFECSVQESHIEGGVDKDTLNPFDDLFASTTKVNAEAFKVHHCREMAAPEDEKWSVVGECRCGNIGVIIPMRGFWSPVVFFRFRIANQEGMLSEASPLRIVKLIADDK